MPCHAAMCLVLIIWVTAVYVVISPVRFISSSEAGEVQETLKRLSSQLHCLQQQHKNFMKIMSNLKRRRPTEEYMNLRQRIYTNTKELWYYVRHVLKEVVKSNKTISIMEKLTDRKGSLLSDQEKLFVVDGHEEWRRKVAHSVSDLVQRRLRYLQHPTDCHRAKKLVCTLDDDCGFGCHLHHIVYCLIFAYATERTLILNSKGWRYNNKGWEYVFHPISDTCTTTYNEKIMQWPIFNVSNAKVISIPIMKKLATRLEFLPPALPEDLANKIGLFNNNPVSWWIGQFIKYILKPRDHIAAIINNTIAEVDFRVFIVGVHVRRTDKIGAEAASYDISEYMSHVDEYYAQLELTRAVDERRIYLATDDASVLDEARKKYPQYRIFSDNARATSAALSSRYTPSALTSLLVDLNMLASCHYIFCTFSSHVGRVAYALMQATRQNAPERFVSLDDVYFFDGYYAQDRIAVLDNSGIKGDVSFEVNDQLGVVNNHWNGYGRGINKRTIVHGLIPLYKTVELLEVYPFPLYKQVSMPDS